MVLGRRRNAVGAGGVAAFTTWPSPNSRSSARVRVQAAFVAIDRRHPGAGLRETCGNSAADAAASAGHHADAAGQAEPVG